MVKMKYIYKIFAALILVGAALSCHKEELFENSFVIPEVGVFGDEMKISVGFQAPDPITVGTRAVDPDGKTLQTLYLFCFDANGLFLTTSQATIKGSSEDNLSGTFSATIPKTTRIIHLLANQNMAVFDKDQYLYKTEDDVLSALEGSAGMLIYWARIEAPQNVSGLYRNVQMEEGRSIDDRTNAEAFVDWLTIETNPTDAAHRGVNGKGHPIIMLRNQARFTIISEGKGSDPNDEWKGDSFEVTGFAVCNSYAFGTVAPYHVDYGFPTYDCSTFTPEFAVKEGEHNWLEEKKVTLAERKDKMSDVSDVSTTREIYVFETNNLGTDPIDLILRGSNIDAEGNKEPERYYYRVNILDDDAELVKILRNHHYEIHISGNLTNGCKTFGEALVAPPTNNVWLSIYDEVKSVRNNKYVLSVEETHVVVEADASTGEPQLNNLRLNFNVKALGEVPVDPNKISVFWEKDEQKVSSTFNPNLVLGDRVSYDATSGDGVITLNLNNIAEGVEYERGAVVVKYGHLQRKIRIVLMRTKSFVPAWVSSEVYGTVTGADGEVRSNVTVVYTIPETCPEELFPMDVLITTNGLDGRAGTGQILPIVRSGEDGYGKNFEFEVNGTTVKDLGYKYMLTVDGPGQYRVYFQNVLNMEHQTVEYVTIEAEHFDFVTKLVTYVDHHNEIVLPQLASFVDNPDAAEEEEIKYILVPQKRFHPVVFDVALKDDDGPFTDLDNEEFLLYSSNLDIYPDYVSTDPNRRLAVDQADLDQNRWNQSIPIVTTQFFVSDFDCYFKPYEKYLWSTGGRIFGFYPRADKVGQDGFWKDVTYRGEKLKAFQIYMETNKPNSAEVVRIASNQFQSSSVVSDRLPYMGTTFRSVTFELANYRPFRFAAQINGEGNYKTDASLPAGGTPESEVVDNIQFTYLPDETVAVSFDVTSFHLGSGDDMVSVDPFGTAFEIFIDAPMLKLEYGMNKNLDSKNFEDIYIQMFDKHEDGTHFTENKPKLEDLGNGRFVYRVDAKNYNEYAHWSDAPKIQDAYYNSPLYGERKTLYFKKKSIVSEGEITISSNPDHVTYHSKTFNVSSAPIQGRIGYQDADDVEQLPVAQFVSFTRIHDGSRIGSLTVKSMNEDAPEAPTYYELRLRSEYEYYWENDPIQVISQIGGRHYSAIIPDLKTLWESPNKTILLTPME